MVKSRMWFCGILLLLIPDLCAQTHNLNFEIINAADGLSANNVFCISQDDFGFMWFGTDDGLNRYDGIKFKTYRHDPADTSTFSFNKFYCLEKSHDGSFWVGGDKGINKFNPETETITHFFIQDGESDAILHSSVSDLYEDHSGVLWVSVSGHGFYKYNPTTQEVIIYRNDPANSNTLRSNIIKEIMSDKNDRIWIGTGEGLDILDPKTEIFYHYQFGTDESNQNIFPVSNIHRDNQDNMWLGAMDGLFKFHTDSNNLSDIQKYLNYEKIDGFSEIRKIAEGPTDILWIASWSKNFMRFDINSKRSYEYPASIGGISCLYVDLEKNLWSGYIGLGLYKANTRGNPFKYTGNKLGNPERLIFSGVRGMVQDIDSILWAASYGGLNKIDLKTGISSSYLKDNNDPHSISSPYICSVYYNPTMDRSTIWLGFEGGGLDRFNINTGMKRNFVNSSNDQLNRIFSILAKEDRQFWLATDYGLAQLDIDDGEIIPVGSFSPLWTMIVTRDEKHLWLGTKDNGLYWFDPVSGDTKHYKNDPKDPSSLGANEVRSILEDSKGQIWVGTFGGGLNKFNPKTDGFQIFKKKDGISSDVVHGILEDDQGNIWASSDFGLSRLNPETNKIKIYDEGDYKASITFSSGSSFKSSTGELFFGGIIGIVSFHPDMISDNKFVPPVVLTDFKLYHKSVSIGDNSPLKKSIWATEEISLTHDQSIFSFEFASLSYISSEKNQYEYRLEGLEEDWNTVDFEQRSANYTNLDQGTYVFRVRATNNDGVWNTEGVSLVIHILPPWWLTSWFRILFGTFLLIGVIVAYRVRIGIINRQKLLLEAQVTERTMALKISRDNAEFAQKKLKIANATKDKFFSIIAHDLRGPYNSLLGIAEILDTNWEEHSDENKLKLLRSMRKNLESSYQLLVNLLDWSRLQKGHIVANIEALNLYAICEQVITDLLGTAAVKEIDLDNQIPKNQLAYGDEFMVGTIMRNLISNAIKFTHMEGEIIISSSVKKKHILCCVQDNGIGMNQETKENLFRLQSSYSGTGTAGEKGTGLGLIICNEFSNLMNAELFVKSTVNSGSKICLNLKKIKE